jgi:predicted transcriptional regulator of viral defense system
MAKTRLPNHQSLYETAEPQAGYFTTAQARAAGFSRPLLAYQTKAGRFLHVAHGLYRLAQFPHSPFEDLFVAWLRAGPDAVISHESALAVYGLSDHLPSWTHLIIPRTASRRRTGLRLHTHQLQGSEITHREGLPLTTVPRTLADISAAGLAEEQVVQAIREALQRGLTRAKELRQYASERGGRGAELIRMTLDQLGNP